ncbi:Shedu immune nuclease family protein [Curtobacterium sp. MCPF17_021]|uniref:Shedu immune nuclease family protein n=1 Tax=Curtobacterium sp. MCPF17_021 TaxID=2175639 RepID=UPI000DA95220|nr:Shedu immune nuclease family protein [Curtobacterium sp. MCPF17_021]WIE82805.1 DUF4263 domain-containing protein [Curtobacterium sp. MCPF17_021]
MNDGFDWPRLMLPSPQTDADYAALRVLGRTTKGRAFDMRFGPYKGERASTVWQIISDDYSDVVGPAKTDEEVVNLHESPAGRVQVKARIVREQGNVAEIRLERVTGSANKDALITNLVTLDAEAAQRLISLCLALRGMSPDNDDTVKFDEGLLAAVLEDPTAMDALYRRDREGFAAVIEADVSARDVVAVAARKDVVRRFEELLTDAGAFEAARAGRGAEAVWQDLFEQNPWLLGVGLAGQLLTSWSEGRLERVVAGASIANVGKRADAVLATTGAIRSLALAELKLHNDPLLETRTYRSGTWAPSREVVGGVAQSLVTGDRARDELERWLNSVDSDGFETVDRVWTGTPRSFLVIGSLSQFSRDGRVNGDMVRSFELYRRNIHAPEIITYDEVLARAKWSVELLERGAGNEPT